MRKTKKKKAATANKMALAQRARRARERKQGHLGIKLKKISDPFQIGESLHKALLDGKKPTGPHADTVNQMVADINKVPVSEVQYETPTDTFLRNLTKERDSLETRLVQINLLIEAYNQ